MRSTLVTLLVLASTSALPDAVLAQAEFTLNVPVEVERIVPEVTSANVVCYLHVGPTKTDPNGDGVGVTPIPLDAEGSFSGVLTVEADTESGIDPTSITRYTCDLNFSGMRPGASDTVEGTEFVWRVEGPIPQP